MATDQQVALTRPHKIPSTSSHISKAARQVVPAFLQKLYEMVNDQNNAELIRWSESGDSFFVLDHERFAHEVLGRWFKHRNFSSFVRQLNMYGFHKIPHLQQGVLKSDTDTEFWNFAHANFHRGQPDLLCLIQRKKQAAQQGDEPAIELQNGTNGVGLIGAPNTTTSTPGNTATLSNGQVLDVQSIVTGITAIKRHQTTISAELNELKRSNQLLWQDTLTMRTRHQKQQDTINRIVKFLAGVFGNHPAAGTGVPGTPSVGGGQGNQDGVDDVNGSRRRVRLMIEDAKRDGPTKSMVEELTEIPTELDAVMQYETPIPIPSPMPGVNGSLSHMDPNVETLNGDSIVSLQQGKTVPTEPQEPQKEQQGKQISRAVTPNRSPTTIEFDSRIHNMLNQLSPSQTQLLLASLAAQIIADPPPSAPGETVNPAATSLTQYQPQFDFSQTNPALAQLPIVDGLISFDHYEPQLPTDATHSVAPPVQQDHEQGMQKQWHAAEEIEKGVSAVDTSINSLIQNFGLDPAILDGIDQNQSDMNETTGVDPSHATIDPEFDFETLFNILSNVSTNPGPIPDLNTSDPGTGSVGMDYGGFGVGSGMSDFSAAFLDDAHTPTASDTTSSPVLPLRPVSPDITMTGTSDADSSPAANLGTTPSTTGKGAGGKKRKSETIADFDGATVMSNTTKGGKVKRRKDK